jgi:hypothetical protein
MGLHTYQSRIARQCVVRALELELEAPKKIEHLVPARSIRLQRGRLDLLK